MPEKFLNQNFAFEYLLISNTKFGLKVPFRYVFWLLDHPLPRLPALKKQWLIVVLSPVTAAVPPRFLTVFRLSEKSMSVILLRITNLIYSCQVFFRQGNNKWLFWGHLLFFGLFISNIQCNRRQMLHRNYWITNFIVDIYI